MAQPGSTHDHGGDRLPTGKRTVCRPNKLKAHYLRHMLHASKHLPTYLHLILIDFAKNRKAYIIDNVDFFNKFDVEDPFCHLGEEGLCAEIWRHLHRFTVSSCLNSGIKTCVVDLFLNRRVQTVQPTSNFFVKSYICTWRIRWLRSPSNIELLVGKRTFSYI